MDLRREIWLVFSLSWRNVWRNRRRSTLTILTIMAGAAMVLFMRSVQNGAFDQMIEDGVSLFTGHIQIHEKGFWKNRTLEYAFKDDPSLLKKIRETAHVEEVSRRIHAGVLMIYGDTSESVEITGIEPQREKDIITLQNYMLPGGRFLKDDDGGSIVLGNVLAQKLGVKTGDKVSILSQGFDGSIAADYLEVVGVFRTQDPGYNSGMALVSFKQAAEIFSMTGYVSSYAVRIDKTSDVPGVKNSIMSYCGEGLEVMAWDELMPEIMQFIIIKRFGSYLYVFILYMIVAFGVLNTIQMSVYERIRELGIMLSIGTGPGQVFAMIMAESVILSVTGVAAGLAAGACISYYFSVYPFDLSGYRSEMELYNVSTLVYYARMRLRDFIECVIFIMTLAVAFTYFPARKASKLDPVRAIRHL